MVHMGVAGCTRGCDKVVKWVRLILVLTVVYITNFPPYTSHSPPKACLFFAVPQPFVLSPVIAPCVISQ